MLLTANCLLCMYVVIPRGLNISLINVDHVPVGLLCKLGYLHLQTMLTTKHTFCQINKKKTFIWICRIDLEGGSALVLNSFCSPNRGCICHCVTNRWHTCSVELWIPPSYHWPMSVHTKCAWNDHLISLQFNFTLASVSPGQMSPNLHNGTAATVSDSNTVLLKCLTFIGKAIIDKYDCSAFINGENKCKRPLSINRSKHSYALQVHKTYGHGMSHSCLMTTTKHTLRSDDSSTENVPVPNECSFAVFSSDCAHCPLSSPVGKDGACGSFGSQRAHSVGQTVGRSPLCTVLLWGHGGGSLALPVYPPWWTATMQPPPTPSPMHEWDICHANVSGIFFFFQLHRYWIFFFDEPIVGLVQGLQLFFL